MYTHIKNSMKILFLSTSFGHINKEKREKNSLRIPAFSSKPVYISSQLYRLAPRQLRRAEWGKIRGPRPLYKAPAPSLICTYPLARRGAVLSPSPSLSHLYIYVCDATYEEPRNCYRERERERERENSSAADITSARDVAVNYAPSAVPSLSLYTYTVALYCRVCISAQLYIFFCSIWCEEKKKKKNSGLACGFE